MPSLATRTTRIRPLRTVAAGRARLVVARLRARPVISLVALVAVLAALGFGGLALAGGGSAGSAAAPAATRFATTDVTSEAGGYRLTVPADWRTTQDGRTTTVVSPGGEAVIRIGAGQAGTLPATAALFFQQVGRNYADVRYLGVEGQQIGDAPALVHAASGVNDGGARIRFLAITVEHQPANLAVAVFTGAGSDPATVLPRVNTVVDTLRPLG